MTITVVSVDTNILLDFSTLNAVDLLFRLPYSYHIESFTYTNEINKPQWLKETLLKYGLIIDNLSLDELFLADDISERAPKLSRYDCFMLALAKSRGMTLATGDKNLRKTAEKYEVRVIGTIFLMEQLWKCEKIDKKQYKAILQDALSKNNSDELRLPHKELLDRLNN